MKKMTAKEKKLVNEIKRMREIVETQIEHCDCQIARFNEIGDKASADNWTWRKLGCKKILTDFGPEPVELKEQG